MKKTKQIYPNILMTKSKNISTTSKNTDQFDNIYIERKFQII